MASISFIPEGGTYPDLTRPRALAAQEIGTPSAYFAEFYLTYQGISNESRYFIIYAQNADAVFTLPTRDPIMANAINSPFAEAQPYYINGNWYDGYWHNAWTNPSGATTIFSSTVNTTFTLVQSTIRIMYNGQPYDPVKPDERIFTKDPDRYNMIVGVAANEATDYDDYVYQTKTYSIQLRWTSQRTGTSYTMPLQQLQTRQTFIINAAPLYSVLYTDSTGSTVQAFRGPPAGAYTSGNIPTEWEDLTDYRSVTEIPLQQLVDFMNTQSAGNTEQDVFTEIFADFIVNGDTVETLSNDYGSLYGSPDIDINGGTGADPNGSESIDDTNVYTTNIELTVPTLTGTGVFNRCYVLDGNGVNDLCDYLYNATDSVFNEIIDGVLTRGNPIESLIDLRLYPFDVRQFTGAGTAQKIKFGRTVTEVVGIKLPHDANAVINLGSAVVPREYVNYLDYLTEVQLYIPFCGVCDLPIDRVLNHRISIKMIVDYITGACTAVVYVDQIPLLYRPGVIGISIPMTATNSAEFGKTIVGNLIKGAGELAAGNPAGAGTLAGAAGRAYEGSHIQTVGASSPQTALYQPKNAYLLLSIAAPAAGVYDPEYAQLVGYQCFMTVATIGYMSGKGFTVFDNVKINVPQATEAERSEILQLLTSGVFM